MEKVRLRQLRANECREIRKAAKVVKILLLYEISDLKTTEQSKIDRLKVDLKIS